MHPPQVRLETQIAVRRLLTHVVSPTQPLPALDPNVNLLPEVSEISFGQTAKSHLTSTRTKHTVHAAKSSGARGVHATEGRRALVLAEPGLVADHSLSILSAHQQRLASLIVKTSVAKLSNVDQLSDR
jgi:hypothetical protein